MRYQEENKNEKENKNVKSNFSREFISKIDEIDKLTEEAYSTGLM